MAIGQHGIRMGTYEFRKRGYVAPTELYFWMDGSYKDAAPTVLGPAIIFDRNSQIRFHKTMIQAALKKSPVHSFMHALLSNHC